MENIKEDFKRDYNNAIEDYNNGDLTGFFRNMRPAIESFCKMVIYDLVETPLAKDLLDGKQVLECDWKTFTTTLSPLPSPKPVEGAMLTFLAKKVVYYTEGERLKNYNNNRNIKNLKDDIDANFQRLNADYGKCSKFNHTGTSADEYKLNAENLSTILPKIFSDFKDILSTETYNVLATLCEPAKDIEFQDSSSALAIERHNDFITFDGLTNKMESTGVEYIVILPSSLTDINGNPISKELFALFFRIRWNLVVDMDTKTEDGLYENAPTEDKSLISIITDNNSEVAGTSNLIYWIFGKGRSDFEKLDDRQILRQTPELFSNTFSKIVRTGKTNDYIILNFCDDFPKFTDGLRSELRHIFGTWEVAAKRCQIISFTKDESYKKDFLSWSNDYGISVHFVSASFIEFLMHIKETKGDLVEKQNPDRTSNHVLSVELLKDREQYRAAGIDFYLPYISNAPKERTWDFYAGAEITYEELDNRCDVEREIYSSVKRRISEIIKNTRHARTYSLLHRPGSGATTLARRLAFDINKEAEKGEIQCTVIDIKHIHNFTVTEKYLGQLAELTDNKPILSIVESKHTAIEKLKTLEKRMSDKGKKVLFFYVVPYTSKFQSDKKEDIVFLDEYLKPKEYQRFIAKYISLGLKEALLKDASTDRSLEVVDFPLLLKDEKTSDNLSTYVSEWLNELPDNLKRFCAYVGFIFKYSGLGVNQNLLKPLWKDEKHSSFVLYSQDERRAISKLLIEEITEDGIPTGIWRPRYHIFSEFILSAYKQNWQQGISDIAKDIIHLCKDAGELASEDKDMLYSVFVIRKNADYRITENKKFTNKFSLLVNELNDVERAESLFQSLVDAFPNDAIFRGHYARLLYEKAYKFTKDGEEITIDDRLFSEAQQNLNIALGLNPDDADLYHMHGMLLRRKIATLEKMYDREFASNPDNIDIPFYEDCLHKWTQEGSEAFEQSISLSPASPYGYADESLLYSASIRLGQKLLQCKDYTFCETNFIYAEYTEKLGNILDDFEDVCYAFLAEELSQITPAHQIYESVRNFHQNIIGNSRVSIEHYRSKYQNISTEKKLFYGNLLVQSILNSRTQKKDTRRAYSNLTKAERTEIENILEVGKNQGDLHSYQKLFWLKLYGPDEYPIDDAIDLLQEWERQFTDNDKVGIGYLNACFYLAVCYCAKAIKADVPNKELTQLSIGYFRKSEDFAKKIDKGTILPLCYLGEKEDIHCIVDKYRKDTDACIVTGVIQKIENNNGTLRMRCGVDVSFSAKGYKLFQDRGQTLRGVLGFRYSGPGLYDFRPDSDDPSLRDVYLGVQEEKEKTFEDLEKKYISTEDNSTEGESQIDNNTIPQLQGPKIVGRIDPATFERPVKKSAPKKQHQHKQALVDGEDFEGEISKVRAYFNIKCKAYPYSLKIEGKIEELYDGADVIFTAKSKPNNKDANKPYWYAANVRLKE